MKRKTLLISIGALLSLAGIWYFASAKESKNADLLVQVKKGQFEVVVPATGELEAKNSVRIVGPSALPSVNIYTMKIANLVAEGTKVKKGEFVSSLDETEIRTKLREREIELQKRESEYTQTELDTALTLRASRDELTNLAFAVKEKDIILEQSKYEPPATIRQAEIDKEKANRNYQQAKQNYLLKKKQAGARMQNMSVSLSQEQDGLKQAQQVLGQFQILAPEDGMVIYVRDWWGNKQTVGSVINIWGDPAIASLPDLSVMISRTYVNEVDIRKIKQGQNVKIGLDAFPEKKMTGKVVTVANVGEQRPNSDAKVFEVSIQVSEKDTTLRPAMTTSNNIVATVLKDVLYVPLEALHSQGDSITYVFKKEGTSFIKQQVKVGQNNDNEAVILEGVKKEDFVFLSVPGKADDRTIVLLPSQARTPKKPASTLSVRK